MKKNLTIISVLIMVILLGACSHSKENSASGSTISIYYIDAKTTSLVSENYELISTKLNEQINELLYMLKMNPDNLVYKSVLPSDIVINFSLGTDGSLTIKFDSTYNELTGVDEILCRAAIVKTLCQLPEVEYVQINVNDNPLIDSNQDAVGPLTAADFIDDTETNTNYKLKLYFANEKGDALIEYDTNIDYIGTDTIEEIAINQLINGPTEIGMYDTIPKGTILLNLFKTDGTCYVDFNEKFLDKLSSITEEVAIYSVVNTLVELPGINKVQFRIDGEVVKTYYESKEFDSSFKRNLDLIEKTK